MHLTKVFVVFTLSVAMGCTPQPKEVTRLDVEKAKICISAGIQKLKNNPSNIDDFVDVGYVAGRIAKSFGVTKLYVASKQNVVSSAFAELAEGMGSHFDGEIVIHDYQQGQSRSYLLTGEIGGYDVNLDARFLEDGTCLLRDARVDGLSIMALLIGKISGMDGFIELIEMDPYA